jgi:hypothetical protein
MKMPIELHLLNFLLINDCYKQYFSNKKNKEDALAFWVITNETNKYWSNVDKKWVKYLKKNMRDIGD